MKLSIQLVALLLGICLLAAALTGCNLHNETERVVPKDGTYVYATFYPLYALSQLIVDGVPDLQLMCLTQPMDGCLRSYSLSNWDLSLLMQSADVVIAGGQGLESFEATLYALGENGPAVVAVLNNGELASVKAANEVAEDSHWLDASPHNYMSIDGAIAISARIAASLSALYPDSAAHFNENLEMAKNRLESLRSDVHAVAGDLNGRKVVAMNEALVYIAQEYGLDVEMYYARESGEGLYDQDLDKCLEMLAGCESKVVLIEKQAPEALCKALEAAGYRVAALDVLSTRRVAEGAQGYFEAQMENAQALAAAFTGKEELEVAE